MESHLLQMRGLKLFQIFPFPNSLVASFTDAWIETYSLVVAGMGKRSHLLQMRGLKRETDAKVDLSVASHLLQMRGLKLNSETGDMIPL